MNIHRLFRTRMIISSIVAAAAAGIGIAGLATDRIYFLPAGMMAFAAIIGYHLAWSSYRFDRGRSGPPEWRALVAEAQAAAEDPAPAPETPATDPPKDEPA